MREFEMWGSAIDSTRKTLIGFDIGGGTPALPKVSNTARVIEAAHQHFQFKPGMQISIETTPRIAANDPQKMRDLRQLGIDRISMGVQTIQPSLLKALGRTASAADINIQARDHIRAAGFEKFNVDVMYGFARQSLRSWQETLQHAIDLDPEYITLYRMRYKGTRIAAQADQVTLDQIHAMQTLAKDMLSAAGYEANPGKNTYSKLAGDPGTSDYLTERVINGTPYLGLGVGRADVVASYAVLQRGRGRQESDAVSAEDRGGPPAAARPVSPLARSGDGQDDLGLVLLWRDQSGRI